MDEADYAAGKKQADIRIICLRERLSLSVDMFEQLHSQYSERFPMSEE